MASPTLGDVHVSVPLTQLSIAYSQSVDNFAAGKVFPNVPVQNASDLYWEYPRDAWFRDDTGERAPNAESAGTDYALTHTGTYSCRVRSVHVDVPDQIRSNSDSGIDLDRNAVELTTKQLLVHKDSDFVTKFFGASLWTGGSGGGDQTGETTGTASNHFKQWDLAGANPIEDIKKQIIYIAEKTGFKPNTLILGPRVAKSLQENAEIVDRVKYTQVGFVPVELLGQAFDVDNVIVPYATQNTATEGASRTMALMYGLSALLVYAAPAPAMLAPSGGYTFSWQGYLGGGAQLQTKSFYMPHKETTRIETSMAYDMKLIGSDLGAFFATAVSTAA